MDIISFILARALDEGSDTPSASSVIYDPSTSVGLVSTDVQSAIDELSTRGGLKNEIVQSLPLTGEEGICYFVPNNSSEIENIYDEYIWFNLLNDYEKIGSTKVDISDLLKSEAITEPYDDTKTYDVGDYVTYLGYLYKCKTAVTTAQSFAPAKWDKIDIFTYIKNDGADYIANEKTYNALSTNNKTLTGAINEITGIVGSDNAPYVFRQTPFIASQENLKSIVGGTVVWNQLLQNGNFDSTSGWNTNKVSISANDNICTAEVTESSVAGTSMFRYVSSVWTESHRYLYFATVKQDESGEIALSTNGGSTFANETSRKTTTVGSWVNLVACFLAGTSTNRMFSISVGNTKSQGNKFYIKNCMMIDLTAMFGSTIANYVNTLETATAGSGIAWLKKYGFFTKPYYAYSANTMQSVNVSAHNTVGFNAYDNSTGKAKLVGGKEYQITGTYTALSYSTGETITPDSNGKFTPTLDGELTVTGGNATNTCVHLVLDGSRDGEYEPYKKNSYDLSGSHHVDRKYGYIEFDGSEDENWKAYNTGFWISIADMKSGSYQTDGLTNWLTTQTNMNNMGAVFGAGNSYLYITHITDNIEAVTDLATWRSYLAGHNLQVCYPLATPTTETVTTPTLRGILKLDANNNLYYDGDSFSDFQNLQIVDGFGTEEFVDAEESAGNRDVAIPVGHNTDYFNSSILAYNIDYTDDKCEELKDYIDEQIQQSITNVLNTSY